MLSFFHHSLFFLELMLTALRCSKTYSFQTVSISFSSLRSLWRWLVPHPSLPLSLQVNRGRAQASFQTGSGRSCTAPAGSKVYSGFNFTFPQPIAAQQLNSDPYERILLVGGSLLVFASVSPLDSFFYYSDSFSLLGFVLISLERETLNNFIGRATRSN